MSSTFEVRTGEATLEVTVQGDGPAVVLVPDLGRGAADFDQLAIALADSGWRSIAVDPRGVGGSEGPLESLTLDDLAADIVAVVEQVAHGPAHLVGHGFGNRVVRRVAATRPDVARSVSLLGAGGLVAVDDRIVDLVRRCFDLTLDDDERLASIAAAFFAPGNAPGVWEGGWWPAAAAAQGRALRGSPPGEWWAAGTAPILVVQGLDDRLAPPANGHALVERLGNRVRLVEVPQAGHALLPEQPGLVAESIVSFLTDLTSSAPATTVS